MPVRPAAAPAPKKSLLVVDSERVTRLTFESILTRAGYRVVTAASLNEAVAVIQHRRFHVILADMVRGKGPALELLAMMNETGDNTPLIVIDRDDKSKSATACLTMGACQYLAKPVHTEELLRAVDKALRSRDPDT